MSDSETVSVARKGRPLNNALRSERERLDLEKDEQILLGVSSYLSNGPGKQLSRDGEVSGRTSEDLLREAEAARRGGIQVDSDREPEGLYRELSQEIDFLEREGERAFFDSASLGDVEISGRSQEEDPLDSDLKSST
ncbi:MAG: hypothetical protein ABEK16_05465 [Candidatus Nanohalobium sp.]